IRECLLHEHIFGVLVSHGSSTVPAYIVEDINALGGRLQNTCGIALSELKAAIPCGIGKINVDTDIRLAVTRNMKELFAQRPGLRTSPSIGGVYALLESKPEQFDPRVFLPPLMDTVMYGNVPDDDVRDLCACIERGVKEIVGTLIVEFGSVGKASRIQPVTLDEMAERYRKEGI
ncbi:MAG: class II fructose-bisphosphate aldolase, partial [Aristaeellaceae bacterium]